MAIYFKIGCLNAMLATMAGAAGAHQYHWDPNRRQSYLYAQIYHFAASFGMIASGLRPHKNKIINIVRFGLFALATSGFSLAIYHRCFTGSTTITKKTAPLGGVSLMLAFFLTAL